MPRMTQQYDSNLLTLEDNCFPGVRSNRQISRRDAKQMIYIVKNLMAHWLRHFGSESVNGERSHEAKHS